MVQGVAAFRVLRGPLEVEIEQIFPGFAAEGAGFDFGQIDVA